MFDKDEVFEVVARSGLALADIEALGRIAQATQAFRKVSVIEQGYIYMDIYGVLRGGTLRWRYAPSGGQDGEMEFSTLAQAADIAEGLVRRAQRGWKGGYE